MVKFALVEKQCAVFLRKKNICALARILLRGRKKCTKLQQYKGPGIAKKNTEEIITLTEKPGL